MESKEQERHELLPDMWFLSLLFTVSQSKLPQMICGLKLIFHN